MLALLLMSATALAEPPPAALAFVPVPGFPSLVERDVPGFGLSLAVAVPGTLAFAAAGEGAGWSRPQTIAAGAAGYYACTVAANQLIPRLRAAPQVRFSPGAGDSATGITAHLTLP